MFRNLTLITITALTLTACKTTSTGDPSEAQQPKGRVAFTNAKLIDGTGAKVIANATVIIDGEKILAAGPAAATPIPKDTTVIDLKGKTLMPGLISNHNHVGSVDGMKVSVANYTRENILKALQQYERYGVTTTTALGVNADLFYELRKEQHAGQNTGADLFGADRGIGYTTGAPPLPPEFSGPAVARVSNATTARERVKAMKERGTDFVKIWIDDFLGTIPKMPMGIAKAIIVEAHTHELRVAAHVYYIDDAKYLARNKVDIFAHGIRNGKVDQELIDLMKKNEVAYIPTLSVDESFYTYAEHPEWMQDPFFVQALSSQLAETLQSAKDMTKLIKNPTTDTHRKAVKTNQQNTKKLYDAGILIGFGTDSGANPWRIPGWAEHRELELLVEAGLTPLQAIQTATFNAAKVLNVKDRGTIAAGKSADFLVLSKDPSENILNTRAIDEVWHRGKKIPRL